MKSSVGPVAEQFLGERQQMGVGLAGKVAETMEPMIVNNVEQSPDWDSEPDQETGFLTRGMLVVPMHYKGNVDRRAGSDQQTQPHAVHRSKTRNC